MRMTPEEAKAFAQHHVEVWNRHEIEPILGLYSDDAELTSPLAATLTPSGVVKGKEALRSYFVAALQKHPDLQFKLVNTLLCVSSVTLYFESIGGRLVAEVLFLDEQRKVKQVFAHYTC